jgi:FtsP/CotA-like multicopper oxidase with cupredoxin domain
MTWMSRGLCAAAVWTLFVVLPASAQDSSIYIQCPRDTGTILNPMDVDADPEDGLGFGEDPDDIDRNGDGILNLARPGAIKCKHLSGGDGMVTMADDASAEGKRGLYIFSFADIPLPGETDELTGETAPTVESGEYPTFVMQHGLMKANAPAPTIEVDEDDELFLALTNVGMAMRPDLFDPHTVHWHGFPQAASVFDGVPDASISVNMGSTLTYYYNAKDAGTYMYHCHVEATEHMQMGMLGNLWVRPRQNRCDKIDDDADVPGSVCPAGHVDDVTKYAYNDGDGTTRYDVEYPIQIGSFDPAFHDASFAVQPLPFDAMDDRYFLLNGRGYPDTVNAGVISTPSPLGDTKPSQPLSSLIEAEPGQKILLRISNLNVTVFNTIATNGPRMQVIGLDARLLRDDAGNNMYYETNSVTLGGGQSADVLISTAGLTIGNTFFLYTTNLDRLANDRENFGGQMTEIRIVAPDAPAAAQN